jgi:hypothetical protein
MPERETAVEIRRLCCASCRARLSRVPELLTGPAFVRLFTSFERTARRLETRDRDAADQALFERWLAGELPEPAVADKVVVWLDQVRGATAAGKRYERVRVVQEPPTAYQRFALATCRRSVAAGEDIRYLNRDQANELDLPGHDFWLFDDDRLVLLYLTADDRTLGEQVIADPAVAQQHRQWFERAQASAMPYTAYLAQDPARELRPNKPPSSA